MKTRILARLPAACCLLFFAPTTDRADELGLFERQTEVGKPGQAGTVALDAADGSYLIAGGGDNMWFTNDNFHFVWKRASGDFTLQAAVEWLGTNGNAHRKA